jgi:hypothetical protein
MYNYFDSIKYEQNQYPNKTEAVQYRMTNKKKAGAIPGVKKLLKGKKVQ